MVRKILFAALLFFALLLGVCKFFAASTFPAYLTQVSAFVDLSKEMDPFIGSAGEDFECRLYVLKNSSDLEYVFVGIHVFSPDKKKVIILDNSLKIRRELEDPKLGDLHMVDVNGHFLIGVVLFDQVDLTLLASPGVDPYRQGFSHGSDNFIIWIDSGFPDRLQKERYDTSPVWLLQASGASLIETGGDFDLENASYSAARNEVALFLHRQGDDSSQVVLIPAANFSGALATPIIGKYPVFPVDSANHENYHYTNDGIVVNTHNSVVKLYGFDGKLKAEFPSEDDHRQIEAYDEEGEYYYHLDVQGRRLYKCGTWW